MPNSKLTPAEIKHNLPPKWQFVNNKLSRQIELPDFNSAISIVNQIAVLSENQQHHPDITIKYNRLILKLSTHSANGVTIKDIAFAAAINSLL